MREKDVFSASDNEGTMTFEDYFGIQQLLSSYSLVLDRCTRRQASWESFTDLWIDDGVFDMSAMDLGRIEGAQAITEAMKIGVQPAGHHVGNLFVHSFSGDEAEVSVKAIQIIFDGRSCTGTYDDTVRRTAGGWKFVVRRPWVETIDENAAKPIYVPQ